ncbi:hypothetical protein [Burkholderia cepacia]|uniref:hypothetical protein n=1 Tax=Burkholderia cepacia TaxID=292 RepID=UPI002AB7A0C2|nr:hypothetical protein [Burkholderia cepacia]
MDIHRKDDHTVFDCYAGFHRRTRIGGYALLALSLVSKVINWTTTAPMAGVFDEVGFVAAALAVGCWIFGQQIEMMSREQ